MLFWWNFNHWLHWKSLDNFWCSLMAMSSKWQYFRLSANMKYFISNNLLVVADSKPPNSFFSQHFRCCQLLTEIGSRNIYLVKHLLNDYDFYYVTPLNNMYGGVGIYVSSNINNVLVLDNIAVEKTCLCPKCEIESLFLNFSYMNESYVIGGIYRHPNGIVNHCVNDLENTLVKFDNKKNYRRWHECRLNQIRKW